MIPVDHLGLEAIIPRDGSQFVPPINIDSIYRKVYETTSEVCFVGVASIGEGKTCGRSHCHVAKASGAKEACFDIPVINSREIISSDSDLGVKSTIGKRLIGDDEIQVVECHSVG